MAWTSTKEPEIKSASEELVKQSLKDGWSWELLCEGDHLCKSSTDFNEIMDHIHSVDGIVEVHIHKKNEKSDWCNIILFNGDPDCEISDCYTDGYIDKWTDLTDFGQNILGEKNDYK